MAKKGLDDEVEVVTIGNPTVPKYTLPREYLSPSQMGMFYRCPKQYMFRYILDDISPPSLAMVMGSAVHRSVEGIHQSTIDTGKLLGVNEAISLFSDTWDDLSEDENIVVEDEDHVLNNKDVGVGMVETYHNTHAPLVDPVSVETSVDFNVRGIRVRGYIDLVERTETALPGQEICACETTEQRLVCSKSLICNSDRAAFRVIDTKVVKRAKTQTQADNDLQLTTYAYGMGLHKVGFDSVLKKPNISSISVKRVVSTRSPQDLWWFEELVEGVATGISSGLFPPCPPDSWICNPKYCGYWSKCRGAKK